MSDGDAGLEAWEARLREAEQDLDDREERALADDPSPGELLALAAERDKIAGDRDTLADAFDDRAAARDRSGLHRDVEGSGRDRTARNIAQDADPGWADRSLAGEDRDLAAGDRGDSFDDRGRSRSTRDRAADDRQRSAVDRDRAAEQAGKQSHQIDHLQIALDTRLTIGRAEGILMERHHLSADAAFAVLVRHSQETNRKLRDLASSIVAAAEASVAQGHGTGALDASGRGRPTS